MLTFNGITITADRTRLIATSCSLTLNSVTITSPEVPRLEGAYDATTTANESNFDTRGRLDQDFPPPGAYLDNSTDLTGDGKTAIVAQRAHTNVVVHESHRLATRFRVSPEACA